MKCHTEKPGWFDIDTKCGPFHFRKALRSSGTTPFFERQFLVTHIMDFDQCNPWNPGSNLLLAHYKTVQKHKLTARDNRFIRCDILNTWSSTVLTLFFHEPIVLSAFVSFWGKEKQCIGMFNFGWHSISKIIASTQMGTQSAPKQCKHGCEYDVMPC